MMNNYISLTLANINLIRIVYQDDLSLYKCQVIDLVYGEVFNRDCMKFNILIQETSLDVIICEDAHSLAEGWMC